MVEQGKRESSEYLGEGGRGAAKGPQRMGKKAKVTENGMVLGVERHWKYSKWRQRPGLQSCCWC